MSNRLSMKTPTCTRLRIGLFAILAGAHVMAPAQPKSQVELVDKPCPETGVRVAVFANGRIEINGSALDVSQLPSTFERLAPAATEVCVHRQDPEAAEPHPNMLKVLDAVIRHRLPISFYRDASFRRRVVFKQQVRG